MRAKHWLAAVACMVAAGAGAAWWAGDTLSRPVRHSTGAPPADLFATPLLIPARGGLVAGWIARGPGAGAVLLLHGVRADRRQMAERALWLNGQGYTVMLIDLPAHGESTGKRITFGAHEAEAVRASIAYLRRNLPRERIGVIGVSLGAAAAVLSRPGASIDALVIEAMYPTIEDAVGNRLSMVLGPPGKLLAPLLLQQIPLRTDVQLADLRPLGAMGQLRSPVLVIGGARDGHTSASDTARIYAAAPAPKSLWLLDDAAHVDFHAHARAAYEARVGTFLAAYLRR